jgi:hypothetical protein
MKVNFFLIFLQVILVADVKAIEDVSIVALLSDANRYNNDIVVFDGYVDIRCDDPAIFISKDASDHNITSLGLGLEIDDELCEKFAISQKNKNYLRVRGIMKANQKGTVNTGTAFQIGAIKDFEVLHVLGGIQN